MTNTIEFGNRHQFRCEKPDWDFNIKVSIRSGNNTDGWQYVSSMVLTSVEDGALIPNSPLSLKPEEAQQLMDELYRCGIRPTDGAGTAGAMRAVERHLEDMRTLVFDKPKTDTDPR